MQHLRGQAPHEKLPKLKSATSMSYYDFDMANTIFNNIYKSLDDLYFGALKEEQELKAKATRHREHFVMTKLQGIEHEDSTTKMFKLDELRDDAPKSDIITIPLCGIDYAESTMTPLNMTWRRQ
ncbi:gag-pol polyprotein [Hordeum vulgare]|nr:gag-pol polyprotein [Hordeum vulgare]